MHGILSQDSESNNFLSKTGMDPQATRPAGASFYGRQRNAFHIAGIKESTRDFSFCIFCMSSY